MPSIATLYTALSALLMLGLAGRVAKFRHSRRVGLGDGGDATLARHIRVHGNAVENLPMALLLLLLLELSGVPAPWLHGFGIALLAGRLLHAFGLGRHSGASPGRFIGTTLTWLSMLGMAVWLLVRVV